MRFIIPVAVVVVTAVVAIAVALRGSGSEPAAATCAGAGVILRGPDTPGSEGLEHAIGELCIADHWADDVVVCIADTTPADDCLDQLTDAQRAAYRILRETWHKARGFLGVRFNYDADRSAAVVVNVLPASPAQAAGIR